MGEPHQSVAQYACGDRSRCGLGLPCDYAQRSGRCGGKNGPVRWASSGVKNDCVELALFEALAFDRQLTADIARKQHKVPPSGLSSQIRCETKGRSLVSRGRTPWRPAMIPSAIAKDGEHALGQPGLVLRTREAVAVGIAGFERATGAGRGEGLALPVIGKGEGGVIGPCQQNGDRDSGRVQCSREASGKALRSLRWFR